MNGFYVTKDTAKKYKLKKVSDLTKVAPKLTFGGPPECEERAALPRRHVAAALRPRVHEVKKLDAGGPITVQALEDGDIDVGAPLHRQQRDPEGRGAAHATTRACSRPTTRCS